MGISGIGSAATVDPVATLVATLTTAAGNYASPQGAWSSSTTYTVNQVVTYGGGTYRAKTTSTNVTPGTDATKWESWGGGVLTSQGGWVTATAYVAGDVVSQSGQLYVCRTAHTSGTFATDLAASKWVSLDAVAALATGAAAAGDLSGTLPSPTVAKVNGVAVSGTPSTGYVLTATGSTAATWQSASAAGGAPTVTTVTTASTAQTLAASSSAESAVYDVTLTSATCAITLTGAQSGKRTVIEAFIRQDSTGGRLATWPSTIRWSTGLAPVLSTIAARTDVIQLVTMDGGTSWYGAMVGMGFAAQAVPLAPTSVVATGGNAKITITWAGVAGALPYVTSYKVYRSTTSGAETLLGDVGNVTTYDDTTITAGVTTYYKVSAVNAVGESALSSEVSASSLTVGSLPSTSTAATMWYTGLGITGVADGASVASWPDSSITNAPAVNSIAGSRPTYIASATPNGLPAVRFITGNYLNIPTGLASGSAFTVFVVAKATGGDTAKGLFGAAGVGGSGAGTGGVEMRVNSGGNLELLSANVVSMVTSGSTVPNAGTQFHVLSGRAATYSGSARAVDVEVDGTRTSTTSTGQITLTTGQQEIGYGFLNSTNTHVDNLAGDVAEVIYYPAALSDSDYALVKNYLATKYAITVS